MEISSAKFREACFKILAEVQQTHKEVVITKRGKPIAKLVHINQGEEKDPLLGALAGVGCTVGDLTEPVIDSEDWEVTH